MAMIMPQELPGEDLERIAAFMNSGGEMDVPEDLTIRGAAVLNILTTGKEIPLRHLTVGRFVMHAEEDAAGNKVPTQAGREALDGRGTFHSDVLCDDNGPTGKWGLVVEDYDTPEDAFLIGVPL